MNEVKIKLIAIALLVVAAVAYFHPSPASRYVWDALVWAGKAVVGEEWGLPLHVLVVYGPPILMLYVARRLMDNIVGP